MNTELELLKDKVYKLEKENEAIKMILTVLVKTAPYTFQMIPGCDSKKASEFGETLEQYGIDNGVILCGKIYINSKNGRVWLEPYEDYLDDVGGSHSPGQCYSPDGRFCGECNKLSCNGCKIWNGGESSGLSNNN